MTDFSQFAQNMDWMGLLETVIRMVAVLLCLTVHEVSHGLAAYALGDPTAKEQHRLSLNPLRHLDLMGTVMMLVAGFGWAKPVPVDARYFKHPKTGMAVTALAGPMSNFIFAYVSAIFYTLVYGLAMTGRLTGNLALGLLQFFGTLLVLNIGLGLFNLIPFPPLDGSKVVEGFLPDKVTYTLWKYERIGMLILMALLFFGLFDVFGTPLTIARDWVMDLLLSGSGWVLKLI